MYLGTSWLFYSICSSCGVRREIPDTQYPTVKTANNSPIFCCFLKARSSCGFSVFFAVIIWSDLFFLCLLLRLLPILPDPVWRRRVVSPGVGSIMCRLCLHDQHSVISAFLQRSEVSYVSLQCHPTPLVAGCSDWCSVMKCDARVIIIIYTLVFWMEKSCFEMFLWLNVSQMKTVKK